jgi:RNA polymerase sigma-70 factor, ECF subfamily
MVQSRAPQAADGFEMLVLGHLDAAYNLARWLLRNPHDAEDAVQDACLRAFEGYGGYAGGSAKAWFLTIVRNVCLTRLSRSASPKVVRLDDVISQIDQQSTLASNGSSDNRPDTQLMDKLDRSRVTQAIARLPDSFREVIVLRELEELSYHDIATVVGVPIGTVMSRLARGRERLRAFLTSDREGQRHEM